MTSTCPQFPERIKDLGELASDLWWSWQDRTREMFRRLDYQLADYCQNRFACCG